MDSLQALLESRQFGGGLTAGRVAALAALLWLLLVEGARRREARAYPLGAPSRPVPGAVGVAFCAAVLAAMDGTGPLPRELSVPAELWVGVGVLVAGGAIASRLASPAVAGMLLALPGGLLLAVALPGDPSGWAVLLVVVGPAVAGATTADLDTRLARSGTGSLLFLIALGGAYATLPDTELVRIALGAALCVTVLAWPITLARFGPGGSYGATGLFLWIAVVEGVGRPGSTVGAAACLGVLLAEPLGRSFAQRWPAPGAATSCRSPAAGSVVLVLGLAQCALALYFARVAGFEPGPVNATVLALPVAVFAVAAAVSFSRAQEQSRPD
jgi:hypothetical protein